MNLRSTASSSLQLTRTNSTNTWLLASGYKPKPGLIVSVYEGYRNGYDVLLPLLERHGFIGWFFVITGFIDAPVKDQLQFALGHDIDMLTREYPDGRYALTWDQLRNWIRSM